jgi:DNA helicase II / ATP-dependent DNA helicase PcrA
MLREMNSTRPSGRRARRSGSSTSRRTRACARHTWTAAIPTSRQMIAIYREYEAACQRAGSVDFAELLLRAHELWRDRPEILRITASASAILVDEFQDTNASSTRGCACSPETGTAVRGRRRRPVDLRLARCAGREHPASSSVIPTAQVSCASNRTTARPATSSARQRVIDHNPAASARSCGPRTARANRSALCRLQRGRRGALRRRAHPPLGRQGNRRSETAILYRTTAQSRLFEEALMQAGIPTGCTAACASSSAPRSRTRSPTCAWSPTAPTTRRSSARSTSRHAASAAHPGCSSAPAARDFGCSLWQAAGDLLRGGAWPPVRRRRCAASSTWSRSRRQPTDLELPGQVEAAIAGSG